MSRTTTSESDNGMMSNDRADSPSIDESSCGGSSGRGPGVILKKGPWTSVEDAILVDYVKKHGEGNWNSVQKNSGLFRCGKSCRLRWANHLRPNLKKGAFTPEEERLIIELHAKMGNKWARMAAHLPGRTDNEIKNYWNTRIKRRQRAGLPLYPPEVCLQAMNEGQQDQCVSELCGSDARQHDILQTNSYDIPDVVFDNLQASHGPLSYAPAFPDISGTSILNHGLGSYQNYHVPPTVHHTKWPQESDGMFPGFLGSVTNGLPSFSLFQNDSCKKIHRPFGLGFNYDPDPNDKNPSSFGGGMTGSHAFLNGNFSASKPLPRAVKLELPSLQYPETEVNGWGVCPPPLASLETIDSFIQSPPPALQMQLDCSSPQNSGLLEEVINGPRSKNLSSERSSNSSAVTPTDVIDCSTMHLNGTEWEDLADPTSPLGCSAASVFSECNPIGNSLDESLSAKVLPGSNVKTETTEGVKTPDGVDKEISTQLEFRPDALLGGDCFEQSSDYAKDLVALLSEDFCGDYKHMSSGTSTSSQGWGLGSCSWNNMPAVCHISELP